MECIDRLPVRRACAATRQAGRTQTGVTALRRIITPARQLFPPKGLSGKRAGTMYSKTYYLDNFEIPSMH